jgi:hypothetical protein
MEFALAGKCSFNAGPTQEVKMNTKKLIAISILLGASQFTGTAWAQSTEQNVNLTIRPSQTVEERVADEVKARQLLKAAEERIAEAEAARIAETNPKTLLSRARVIFVDSDTSFFEPTQLQNALRKREEFVAWQMAIIDAWDKRNVADVIIDIDRPLFTYTFTYKITSRSNGIVLASGKVTAFDGNAAAPKLAQRIIEEMKVARGEAKSTK